MNESFINEALLVTARQRLPSIIWLVFVVVGIIMSSSQMTLIFVWKPLRTFDQILIFFVAASDFFKATVFGILAGHRIYLSDHNLYDARTQLECLQQLLPAFICSTEVMASMMMISLDRLLGMSVPVWYTRCQRKIKICLVIASVLVGFVYGPLVMIGGRSDVYQLSCSAAISPTPPIRKMFDYVDNICCGIVVLINAISCSIVYSRWRKGVRANENMTVVKKRIQLHAMKTLIAILTLFLFSVYANLAFNTLLANLPISENTRLYYGPIGVCASLSRSVFDFPIYLIMCGEYRNGFQTVFIEKIFLKKKKKKNVIVPLQHKMVNPKERLGMPAVNG